MAMFIAARVALLIPQRSMASGGTVPIPTVMADPIIGSINASRFLTEISLLSRTHESQLPFGDGGSMTADATTGPAKEPLPTSSIPAMN